MLQLSANNLFSLVYGCVTRHCKIVMLILWNGFQSMTPKNLMTAFKIFLGIWSALTIFLKALVKLFAVIDQNPFHNINITILKVQLWNPCNSEKCRFKQFRFPCTKLYHYTGHCARERLLPHIWFYQIKKWTDWQLIFMHIILFTANGSIYFMIVIFLTIELWEVRSILFVSKMMSSPVSF